MLIQNYGLFWRASEINWNPGKGVKDFRLLGRQGVNKPGLRIADFRNQKGIYILYGNYGAYYVGLTREQGLGKRLKDHLTDGHKNQWDRFSWFGFCATLKPLKASGICPLKDLPTFSLGSPTKMIGDMEALLIKALGPINFADMKFQKEQPWLQVEASDAEQFLSKVQP